MGRIKRTLIGSMCLLALLLTDGGQMSSGAQSKMPLRLGYLPLLTQLPLIISYEEDRLNLHKVDLELIRYNSFTSLEAALRVGAIDAASIPVPIAFSMAGDGVPITILGTFHAGGSRLVASKKGDLPALRGNLIGVPGLDSNEHLKLIQVLESINLRPGLDYKTIGVSFFSVVNDLKANKLDAFYLPEPFGTIAETEKIAVEVAGEDNLFTSLLGTVLVIQSEILEKNRAGVEEWLRSLVKSCRFIEEDIKVSSARQMGIIQEKYFQFPKEIVTTSLTQRKGNLKFDQFLPDPEEIQKYLDLSSDLKILKKSIDLNTLISLEMMAAISK